jgi:hypothetical protein
MPNASMSQNTPLFRHRSHASLPRGPGEQGTPFHRCFVGLGLGLACTCRCSGTCRALLLGSWRFVLVLRVRVAALVVPCLCDAEWHPRGDPCGVCRRCQWGRIGAGWCPVSETPCTVQNARRGNGLGGLIRISPLFSSPRQFASRKNGQAKAKIHCKSLILKGGQAERCSTR